MASNVKVDVHIDQEKLERVALRSKGTGSVVGKATYMITKKANSMADGFRTGIWHDHKTGEKEGNTPARYDDGVKLFKDSYLGIVYTANYAAQKDNLKNNTLLKAKG